MSNASYLMKRSASTVFAKVLVEAGFVLQGYKEDQSDSMTDYYSPASFLGGIAVHPEFPGIRVACLGSPRWGSSKFSTPKGCFWHVENDEQILLTGRGAASMEPRYDGETGGRPGEAARKAVAGILAFLRRATRKTAEPATGASVTIPEGIKVSEGRRPGYVEISFPARPERSVLASLKAAGFRWNPADLVWWGPASNLPSQFQGQEVTP